MDYKDKVLKLLMSKELTEEQKSKLLEIFPEFKESEDERIKKATRILVLSIEQERLSILNITRSEILAWLEKQGETFTKKDVDDAYLKGVCDAKQELEKQGEQKPADLKTKAGNWYICDEEVMNENMVAAFHPNEIYYCPKDGYLDVGGALFEVGYLDVFRLATEKEIPQPKQEWSEEDDKMLDTVIEDIVKLAGPYVCYRTDVEWLKSLKGRVQPKVEWSEENERIKNNLLSELTNLSVRKLIEKETEKKYASWLKSLRPQNWTKEDKERYISCLQRLGTGNPEQPETINSKWFKEHVYPLSSWKPSDEQMKALEGTFVALGGYDNNLRSLINDLKKL